MGNKNYNNNRNSSKGSDSTKKHSGAKHRTYFPHTGENAGVEQHLTTGWQYRYGSGLTKVKCVTTKKSELSEKGWFGSVFCTVTSQNGQTSNYWGSMHKATGKVVINALGWVLNPKANNGGYCGSFLKSR